MKVSETIRIAAAAILAGSLFAAGPAAAADSGATVKFHFFEVKGANIVIGKTFKIDEVYGAEHKLTVKAPFRFIAPTGEGFTARLQATPGTATFVKVVYGTPDEKFIENFQFIPLTVGLGAEEDRIQQAANLLATKGFEMVVRAYTDPKRDGVRKVAVGGYPAVEVFGRYMDPENGLMYARLVGILNPKSEHCILMVANVAAAQLPLEHPDQLATKTRSGAALTTFKYLE